MKSIPRSLMLALACAVAGPVSAQDGGDDADHRGHAGHPAGADSGAAAAGTHPGHTGVSPYADLAVVEGTSMTADEVAGLRSGLGMRLALPAELNGFPGPLHVLELREDLGLDAEQARAVERVRETMLAEAIAKGEEIVEADRALAGAFRDAHSGAGAPPTPAAVEALALRLALLRGQLQAIHLRAHLAMMDVLRPDQVARYQRLRGYAARDHG